MLKRRKSNRGIGICVFLYTNFYFKNLFYTVDMKISEKSVLLPYKALKRSKIGSLSANSSRILIFSNLSIGSEEMKLYKFK